ncbi:AlpA family phage regulatory protein [Agrobacterium tumefaciens]|uniref:AlpA family phage regulatory protein n=1 Tax=Agrobacterium tumefaciens TaxID=358 RepID=A0AAP9E0M4_AGRTU|nr:AlpA family phage regulatory protein [Agrobacterium tumefaciens]NSZ56575.1 AlpA family phage regulatory protein [Agrobacterium tumefaciens]QDY92783.1 AlpA family phage regulatory protein [Agrobacterium tumefaciens]UXS47812.1 AlpA family phage regulatory protein [Agrobacterium tumefaciens]UXS69090.1 AlpA family phage regulatory protein [Agrobacterium tumefaciens]UXS76754.1 AlpA family phage regulatory protein [Agrobacterium tumefaciens]
MKKLLNSRRFYRLSEILAPDGPIPISKSSWWNRVATGEFPSPVKLGPRTTAWRASDIEELIQRFEGGVNNER